MTPTMARGAEAYYQTHVQSRSPLELVVMLYDGALRFCEQAADALDRGDMATKAMALSRAFAILAELQNTLNVRDGGDVARQLDALYVHMNDRLVDANLQRSSAPIREVIQLLAPLARGRGRDRRPDQDLMTFDDVLLAYIDGLDAEIAILRQVEALALEQRTAGARDELLPLGSLATRRAALMHELAATETRIAPLRDRLRSDLVRARRTPGYPRAEARSPEARALIRTLMAAIEVPPAPTSKPRSTSAAARLHASTGRRSPLPTAAASAAVSTAYRSTPR
jgi:flagellar protein FliS